MACDSGHLEVLAVDHLCTEFVSRAGVARAVDDVSFRLMPGQIMALVGESGSGKSMTGYSMLGLVDPPGYVADGQVWLNGRDGNRQDLLSLPPKALRQVRGNRVAMIFQDPMMTLNPVLRMDTQMIEAIRAHQSVGRVQAREMACQALARVGIAAPEARLKMYPHQFSGGMRQRVVIAMALLNAPDVIIADEPTTALDVTIQGQILFEMQQLCRETGAALIWITHDLSVVAGLADTVSVMYAGRIVEQGPVRQVLEMPRHPYTYGLIASSPGRYQRGQRLQPIEGAAPSLHALPEGCHFRPRCRWAQAACTETPLMQQVGDEQTVRCFYPLSKKHPFA